MSNKWKKKMIHFENLTLPVLALDAAVRYKKRNAFKVFGAVYLCLEAEHSLGNGGTFTMEGGTIYGKTGSLPDGSEPSLANSASNNTASLSVYATAKWGAGGAYTKGGEPQTGGSDIGSTDDTLIAIPAQ
jgi:hypothetical protein